MKNVVMSFWLLGIKQDISRKCSAWKDFGSEEILGPKIF